MLTNLLASTNGKKTYGFVLSWVVLKLLQNHGILGPQPDLEIALLGGAGLSLRDGVGKK